MQNCLYCNVDSYYQQNSIQIVLFWAPFHALHDGVRDSLNTLCVWFSVIECYSFIEGMFVVYLCMFGSSCLMWVEVLDLLWCMIVIYTTCCFYDFMIKGFYDARVLFFCGVCKPYSCYVGLGIFFLLLLIFSPIHSQKYPKRVFQFHCLW